MSVKYPLITNDINPYRDAVIGKTNEPITVAGLLDRSKQIMGQQYDGPKPDWSLGNIFDRLEHNAPRIAVIGGSSDHPAHIMDYQTVAYATMQIWQNGGIPFYFSTPVMCDGTAQDNQGMSYSLQSRNAVAQMIANQMEAHMYHGAFVIQGCDKQPLGVVSALAHLDRIRKHRGEAPVFAVFAPAQVMSGGSYPKKLINDLQQVAERAEKLGASDVAEDIIDTLNYVLLCSTNTSFQGVLMRAIERGVISQVEQKDLEKRLAISTNPPTGGVCAFNGTGNSSRHIVAGLGLVHPALELLKAPPTKEQVEQALDCLAVTINNPVFSITNLLATNIKNAVRIHSASGGSTNLLMHAVAGMIYGGFKFDLWEYDRIHHEYPVPDLFDYSLTEGRDIYTLAKQCCAGNSRGMESLFHELVNNGVPMDMDAPTVTGTSWRQRLEIKRAALSAEMVSDNPLILSKPRRSFSGVDVITGNFFESAVVKISGMSTQQLDDFDKKVSLVIYLENESEANRQLLDTGFLEQIKEERKFSHETLLAVSNFNNPEETMNLSHLEYDALFNEMVQSGSLKLAVVISGQGPEAFGMPEMYTPMQHINANRLLRKLVTVISDGRYSGVTMGAAIGHMTPEAFNKGGILYLEDGDLLTLGLREKQIDLLDTNMFLKGQVAKADFEQIKKNRQQLANQRLAAIRKRQKLIMASNRLTGHTDAAHGVVPQGVFDEIEFDYQKEAQWLKL